MGTTQQQKNKDAEDFAATFNGPEPEKKTQTEDEAFGITDETTAADAPADVPAAASAEAAKADPAAAAPADTTSAQDQALKDRAAELDKRELELSQREAAMQTSNTNEMQTSITKNSDADGDNDKSTEPTEDPEKALAEDFGPEFVSLMTALIKKVVSGSVTDSINPLQSTIESIIEDLRAERNANHFKAIKAAHEDFMDVVEGDEFKAWVDSLPDAEKADMQRVIDAGSAEEIISMLTKFKGSKQAASESGSTGVSDDDIDAAEGVRSSGLRLPPAQNQSEDYAAAWNAA